MSEVEISTSIYSRKLSLELDSWGRMLRGLLSIHLSASIENKWPHMNVMPSFGNILQRSDPITSLNNLSLIQ